jgi:hypothetical protein
VRGEPKQRTNTPQAWPNPRGELRLSASGLWLRDTPEGRDDTVRHELGHLLAESKSCGAGHGPIWKAIVVCMGGSPIRCHTIPKVQRATRRRAHFRGVALQPMLTPEMKARLQANGVSLDVFSEPCPAEAASHAHQAAQANEAPRPFRKGDVVVFGRTRGEKTRARVVRVNQRTLTLETLEERGRQRVKGAGKKWRVPPSLCKHTQEETA